LVEEAVKVTVAPGQIVPEGFWFTLTETVVIGFTVMVGVFVSCLVHPVAVRVANTLKVVVVLRFPVGKLMVLPSPAVGPAITVIPLRSSYVTPAWEAATVMSVPLPSQTSGRRELTVLSSGVAVIVTVAVPESVLWQVLVFVATTLKTVVA
jgi:hypothetical protein